MQNLASENTTLNMIGVILLITVIVAGLWIYLNPETARQMHKQVLQTPEKMQEPTNFFTIIEVEMYAQTPETTTKITKGLTKIVNGRMIGEILDVKTRPAQEISTILETNKIVPTKNYDITITLNALSHKENEKIFSDETPIKIGAPFTAKFKDVLINGTITKIK